jgi:hypothetical protein
MSPHRATVTTGTCGSRDRLAEPLRLKLLGTELERDHISVHLTRVPWAENLATIPHACAFHLTRFYQSLLPSDRVKCTTLAFDAHQTDLSSIGRRCGFVAE